MSNFFTKLKISFSAPEMRGFWIFVGLAILILVIDFLYLPYIWLIVSAIIFIALGTIIFLNNLAIAKKNLDFISQYNRLQSIIINLRDGIIGYDNDLKIQDVNKAAEQILGITKEEIIGKIISPELASTPEYKILTQTMFPSLAPVVVRKSEPGISPQIIDITFDNPRMELRVSTDRVTDASGKVLGFVKIIRDRTRELDLLRSKSEFITIAAHQLRTPLTAVKWALESLRKETSFSAENKELVETGFLSSEKLMQIVDDLLNVSKIEEGRFGYVFQNFDIAVFVENLLKTASILAKKYSINLYFDKPSSPIELQIDPQKLGMALSNLIDNAIKYNVENGQVTVKIERYTEKPYVEISIKDTGVGIPPEEINKLFTKFYRGTNVVKAETEGTGLGLYITKNIIERHGGGIWAESELNRGTIFHVSLPTDPKLIPGKEIVYGEE